MDLSGVINQMLVLLLAVLVGYIAGKRKIMDRDSNRVISKLINYITMPALCLSTVSAADSGLKSSGVLGGLGLSVLIYICYFLISMALPKLFGMGKKEAGLYRFMLIFGNVAFMGFPVVSAIYGEGALFYVTVLTLPFAFLVLSVGVYLVSGEMSDGFLKKVLTSPGIIASTLSILLFFMGISLPEVIADTAALLGSITTPAAMLMIGSSLSMIPLKSVFNDRRIYVLSLLRLVVLPILVWLILRPLISDPVFLGVLVVITAMPVATYATILCNEFDGDQTTAARGIFISTVLSFFTIPLLAYLVMA